VSGDQALTKFLQYGVGVKLADIDDAIGEVRSAGWATIQHVVLTPAMARQLGL
jgi:hypothetical protein